MSEMFETVLIHSHSAPSSLPGPPVFRGSKPCRAPVTNVAHADPLTDWHALQQQEADPTLSTYMSRIASGLANADYNGCGLYAQKLGRALDEQGRYAEAVTAFDTEMDCWGRFPDRAEWILWDARRAEQIRPAIQAFVTRPTTPATSATTLAKHEPAFGTMLGGTVDRDPAINSVLSRVAQTYGKSYAMVLVYANWNEPLPWMVNNAKAAGSALQVGWQPNQGLDAVLDDTYLRSFARSLKAYGLPVFLRFGGEMNGAWVEWYGDPVKYQEKWRLVTRVMREEAPNVAMVWSPNFVGDAPFADYYPGDDWVDWVGINLYHESTLNADATMSPMVNDIYYQAERSNPLDKVKAIYETYASRKPLMLSETGFGWATRATGADHTAWAAATLKRFYGYAPLIYPRLKAISYFNVDIGFGKYVLSANPTMKTAFQQATASSWYLSSPTTTAPSYFRPAEQSTLEGETTLSSYVNLGGGVSRVEYLVNGRLAATATQLPFTATLNLTGVQSLVVRAYDLRGALGFERTYPIDANTVKVQLQGHYLDFDQPPIIQDGRTLVPARAILEALGATLSWEAETKTVIAVRDGHTLRLQIGNPIPTLDGAPLEALAVPAQIIGGRTLVPARFVATNYQMNVTWNGASRTVEITPQAH
jgi:hypothetical protein